MSLIISTGSNLGDREHNLALAAKNLQTHFKLIKKSSLYESPAVDYLAQPDFLNQVFEFQLPSLSKIEVLHLCLDIESSLGRTREIDKGPRTVDIDILFWSTEQVDQAPELIVPHPRLFERSFIVLPLKELPYFTVLKDHFNFPKAFSNTAKVYTSAN